MKQQYESRALLVTKANGYPEPILAVIWNHRVYSYHMQGQQSILLGQWGTVYPEVTDPDTLKGNAFSSNVDQNQSTITNKKSTLQEEMTSTFDFGFGSGGGGI